MLAVALLVAHPASLTAMTQYIGMYWFVTGLTSIVWGRIGAKATRLWLAAGIAEVVGGLVIIFRQILLPGAELADIVELFAAIAFLTGLLQISAAIRIRQKHGRKWAWGGFFMGLLQMLMGLLVLFSPRDVPMGVILAAISWALIGGVGLIADALRLRRYYVGSGERDRV